MMIENYDQSVKKKNKTQIGLVFPSILLIISGSGSAKTNVLLNLKKYQQPHNDKIYLYVKDPFEPIYHLLINGIIKVGIKEI